MPSAGPQAIAGTSGAPARVTVLLNVTSYGRSGENEKSLVADSPLASRYSKLKVPGALVVVSDSALALNSALSSTVLTA